MKVILLKNVPNLGLEGDVKDVAMGYARNFLFVKNLAVEASPERIKEAEEKRAKRAEMAESDLAEIEALAQKLEGQMIELSAKASEEGTLYATVSPAKIAAALKAKGFEVNKDQINAGHIKEIGEHTVVIGLDHGLEAKITLIINPEKK